MQQVCFVLMLIFAISFFLSSCFVHLFTFLSLFLHSREQWLKCAYIYYSFVVFILKTVSKSCLLTKNISNIEEVDDKNNTNVGYKTFHWKWAVKEHYGPSLRGKGDDWHIWYPKYCTQLDIFFGVWTTGMFLSSQNQHSFLYPFIMLELQNFFPRCLDLIKLEHLMTTRCTYKCNNCTLYLYLYYQALCLLLEWEI